VDRPTCKTCPYWVNYTCDSEEPARPDSGGCELLPPQWVGPPIDAARDVCPTVNPDNWSQPCTNSCDGCGQHPDFPAYLKALAAVRD
jgi:hypothetical protein